MPTDQPKRSAPPVRGGQPGSLGRRRPAAARRPVEDKDGFVCFGNTANVPATIVLPSPLTPTELPRKEGRSPRRVSLAVSVAVAQPPLIGLTKT